MTIRFIRRSLACLLLAFVLAASWAGTVRGEAGTETVILNTSGNRNIPLSIDPIKKNEGFTAVLYDNRNGMPTGEANAIAQTADGFIWLGSYAGLIRYDGNTFERMDSTNGISNVRCLYVDSRDRLWIGTNDSGVFMMFRGEVRKWNKEDGMRSVSIRSMVEDEDGRMYIGTAAGLAIIRPGTEFAILKDERLNSQTIRELRRGGDNRIYGVTANCDLFILRNGKVEMYLDHETCRVQEILSILPDPQNPSNVWVGTQSSTMYYGNPEENFPTLRMKQLGSLTSAERLEYIDGQVWICGGNGIGKVDAEGFHTLRNVPMDNSIGNVMTDYMGNLWFTSTRQGVMKIVPNQFSDLSERYGLPSAVINTTCMYGRQLFIGTDTGLMVAEDGKKTDTIPLTKAVTASGLDLKTDDLLGYLDGVRIRSINRDSRGRLWISTWRSRGLLRYDKGELLAFTTDDGLLSDQIRTVSECEDGRILVANRGGVSVIEGDKVTGCWGEEDGITDPTILTVTEGFNHEVIAGTDGGGIFVIDDAGTRHIGTGDGLDSEVILRIKRSENAGVYWIVTSNSLAYMTPDCRVTTIRKFPYPNNYDLYENSRGEAWILSSTGIFVASTEELLTNENIDPAYFSIPSGLPYIATANSFSELTSDGDLYIAGTGGVAKTNIEKPSTDSAEIRAAVPYVDADGVLYYPDASGSFALPGNARKITIYPYVFNYLLNNPQVSWRLEGFDREDTTVSRDGLDPVAYTNLPVGTYRFTMTVRDPVRRTGKTVSFRIVKGKESTYGVAGSIIMDLAALFFMGALLIYTSLYRKRGRVDDKLFFAMIVCNMIVALSDMLIGLLEGASVPLRGLILTGNIVFYTAVSFFPYQYLLFLNYRITRDLKHMKRMQIPAVIPVILLVIALFVNLFTGWLFTVGADNIYRDGIVYHLVYLPALLYLALALIRGWKLSPRLVLIDLLLIALRIFLEYLFRDICSTAFIYTLFLVYVHIHALNRPLNEEAA